MGLSVGRILIIPKDEWNEESTYFKLDLVRHNEATWVCKNNCTGSEPSEENENWQVVAKDSRGDEKTNLRIDQLTDDLNTKLESEPASDFNDAKDPEFQKTIEEYTTEVRSLKTMIDELKSTIDLLIGEDTNKSIRVIAEEVVKDQGTAANVVSISEDEIESIFQNPTE